MENQLALEIGIKTTLEGAGIKATSDEVKALAKDIDSTTKAGERLDLNSADLGKRLEGVRKAAGETGDGLKKIGESGKAIDPATKSVDDIAKSLAAASTKGGEFSRTLAKLSSEELAQVESAIRKEISAAQALGQSTTELDRRLDETTSAQKRLAPAAENTSRNLHELGKGYNEGAQAGRVLSEVAQGNISQIGQLGSAVKTLGLLLKTNFIAGIFTLGAVAIQAVIPIVSALNERFGKTKKTAEEVTQAFNDAEAAGQSFANTKLEQIGDRLDAIKTKAEAARAVFRELLELQGKRDEVIAAAKNAQIDANPKLTASQKTEQKATVDQDLIAAQRRREDALRRDQLDQSSQNVDIGKQKLNEVQQQRDDQQAKIDAATLAKQFKEELKQKLKEAEAELLLASSGLGDNPSIEQQQKVSDISKTIQDTTQALKNSKSDEELGKAIKDAAGEIERFEVAVKAAQKVLAELVAADAVVQKSEAPRSAIVSDTRKAEDVKRGVDLAEAAKIARDQDAAEEAAFKKRSVELKGEIASAKASGDALGQSIAVAALKALNATFKPGLAGAEKRSVVADKQEAQAVQALPVDRTDVPFIQGSPLVQAIQAPLPSAAPKTAPPPAPKITINGETKTVSAAPLANQGGTVQRQAAAPFVVKPGSSVADQQKANESKIDPALDEFFGTPSLRPVVPSIPAIAPAPSAATGAAIPVATPGGATVASAQPEIAAGLDKIASAVDGAQKPEPVDVSQVVAGIDRLSQTTVQVIGETKQNVAEVVKRLAAAEQAIANLNKGQRSLAENAQS